MATSKTSEAKAKVGLDSSSFEKGAKAVMAAANAMSSVVTAAMATAGAAILAALGAKTIGAVFSSIKGVFSLGESLANAGKRAGIAAGQFYLFNNAVEKGLSLKTVAGLIGENAEVLNRSASTFRDVSIKLWAVGEKIRGFWLGLMDRIAPVLSRILDGTLGASLVSAGEWFGDAITNAVGVIYQLAKDGKLWDTLKLGLEVAFKYAAEQLLRLGMLGHEVLKETFSEAFFDGISEGLAASWKEVVSFSESFKETLKSTLMNAFVSLFAFVNRMLDGLDTAIKFFNGGNRGDTSRLADERKQARDNALNTFRGIGAFLSEYKSPEGDKGPGLMERISGMLQRFEFNPSEGLTEQIELLRNTVAGALTGYKAEEKANPPTKFENNTRVGAFGADSLTSIGGGGGVYLGLSVLDVNKMQLSELRRMNQTLDRLGPSSSLTVNNMQTSSSDVSRAQTSAPVK